jgi:hypothetical protein
MTDDRRDQAASLDADDPVASFRDRFVVGAPDTIYLDGNSLGRLPLATRERLHELIEVWGRYELLESQGRIPEIDARRNLLGQTRRSGDVTNNEPSLAQRGRRPRPPSASPRTRLPRSAQPIRRSELRLG